MTEQEEMQHLENAKRISQYPFNKTAKTLKEWEEEMEYFWHSYDKVKNGTYKTLYEQRQQMN